MASSLAVQKFEGQSIAPFSGGSPALGYTGGGGSAGKPLIGGKPEGVLDEMVSFFDKIDAGILKLVDLFDESLGFDKKADEINKEQSASINKMADVMADDLDLEKIQTDLAEEDLKGEEDARTTAERMAAEAARGEGLEEQDVPRRGMLDTLKAGAGKVGAGFSKIGEAYANMGDKMKVAFFATIAIGLASAAGKLNEIIAPVLKILNEKVIPAFKKFFSIIVDDIGPIFDNIVDFWKEAFDGIGDLLKGVFEGDAGLFLSGIKKIFLDLPIRLVSIIGDAFFSLADAALQALGIDAPWVEDIAQAFRELPEAIDKAIQSAIDFFVITIPEYFNKVISFFTKTIPTKFDEMKTSIMTGISNMISFIVDPIVELKDNIAEGIDTGVEKIKSSVVGIINKIKDVFAGFVNNLKGMANSVIDLVNKIPGVNFGKFEMTPLSTDEPEFAAMDTAETGDATIAENVASERRLKVEKKSKFMKRATDRVFGKDDDSLYARNKSYKELGDIMDRHEANADLLFQMNEADKLAYDAKYEQQGQPIVVANTTTGGDVVNQTSVHSAEPASDHQDSTAKLLANAMA